MKEKKPENQLVPTRPKSDVWKYFEDCFDEKHVKCMVCPAKGVNSK